MTTALNEYWEIHKRTLKENRSVYYLFGEIYKETGLVENCLSSDII